MKQLEKHFFDAEKLKDPTAEDLFFSKGTYQIGLKENGEEYWPFLQISDSGQLQDGFCNCTEEDETGCAHLAKAYLIASGKKENASPLHMRFTKSLFNRVGLYLYKKSLLSSAKVTLEAKQVELLEDKEKLFLLKTSNKVTHDFLQELIDKSGEETEETSLKFSNLSAEELSQYEAGNVSDQLGFKLSLWGDIAKWLFAKAEFSNLKQITFIEEQNELPRHVEFDFGDIHVTLGLSETELGDWLEGLMELKAPKNLTIERADKITKVSFDGKALNLERSELSDINAGQLKRYGEFIYEPNKGFWIAPPRKEQIGLNALDSYLMENHKTLSLALSIDPKPRALKTELFFDEKSNLHLRPYIETKGDLDLPSSAVLTHWAYSEKKGFVRIEKLPFGNHKIVRCENVGEFLHEARFWLEDQPGFAVHLFQLDTQWSYEVNASGQLTFSQGLMEMPRQTVDLGKWIYVEGEGFFQKKAGALHGAFAKKASYKPKDVSNFIDQHTDELSAIKGFFAIKHPIKKRVLSIQRTASGSIEVEPSMHLEHGVKREDLIFFDRFVYWKGRGFSPLFSTALPIGYEKKKTIPKDRAHRFLHQEIGRLLPFIEDLPKELTPVDQFKFSLKSLQKKKGRVQWLLSIGLDYDSVWLSATKLAQACLDKEKIYFTPWGYFDLEDERFSWMFALSKDAIESEQFSLKTVDVFRILAFDFDQSSLDGADRELLDELLELKTTSNPKLEGFLSELRSYQKIGLNWLWSLYEYGLSGLLCDDMGLGKTHQAMALMAALTHVGKKQKRFVVVCPTSVIYHWQDLIKTYLPRLKVYIYHGQTRSLDKFKEGCDVLLTSYGILRRGDKKIRKVSFDLAIFDEVQIAKNFHSQTHEALTELKCQMIVGLSGTPLENKLEELRALFDIVLPSYLPDEALFKRLFTNPIERSDDSNKKHLLRRLIAPFILRRKKSDVLFDLPKKIEQSAYSYMEDEQRLLYEQTAHQYHGQLQSYIHAEKGPIPFTSILALLTKLKMICSHPALFLGDTANYGRHPCGKWKLFCELLREARSSEQKIVVFTQYLGMIDIIKRYLTEQGIGYASIQGATVDRKAQIARFVDDPTCEVFVGSLRAVGLGVNLSCGSCVIHYDRWWNPAWENQATDRVHRIGQRRGVQVFKLITKNSIEEKIDEIIQRKTKLLDIVEFDEGEDILGTFTKEDWLELIDTLKVAHRSAT